MDELPVNVYAAQLHEYEALPHYDCGNVERYIAFKISNEDLSWEDVITRVHLGLDYDFYTYVKSIEKPDGLTVLVNKYNQLPFSYIPADLEVIAPEYNEGELVLRHKARLAFEEMCRVAGGEGIGLKAISTFRSAPYQNDVYYRKLTSDISLEDYQKERDKVSARAGFSEHQTGLAVDINDLEETFEATPEGRWLADNCYRFGFVLRYPKGKEGITGYSYEPWHFRYLGLYLAEAVYQSGLTFDEYYIRYLSY